MNRIYRFSAKNALVLLFFSAPLLALDPSTPMPGLEKAASLPSAAPLNQMPADNKEIVSANDENIDYDKINAVLQFWFGPEQRPDYFPSNQLALWLDEDIAGDKMIKEIFFEDVQRARRGDYNQWRNQPLGRLALIILLDQFPRRIYHNQVQAYASDSMAKGLVIEGIAKREDKLLNPIQRAFFYLPLEHAEDREAQNLSVQSYTQLLAEAPTLIKPAMQQFLNYALIHQQQIAQFGRFPHRNAILGRQNTLAEINFLNQWNNQSTK